MNQSQAARHVSNPNFRTVFWDLTSKLFQFNNIHKFCTMTYPLGFHSRNETSYVQTLRATIIRQSNVSTNYKLHNALADPDCKVETIEKLLTENVDIKIFNEKGQQPIHIAVSNPHCNYEVIALLIRKGASVNAKNTLEETPLHVAVKQLNCRLNVVKSLLKRHCHVNAQDSRRNTPLHIAVQTFHSDLSVIEVLLDYKANVMATNIEGLFPLYLAFKNPNCSLNLVKMLMRGFDWNRLNNGFSPLQGYIYWGNFRIEIFEELVNQSANLWEKSHFEGRNILHYAVHADNSYIVLSGIIKIILKQKHNCKISDMINKMDINLNSPLDLALTVINIDVNVISLLLKHGANHNNKISVIKPLRLAIQACHAEAVEVLLKYHCQFFQSIPFRDIITKYAYDNNKYRSCFWTVLKYYAKVAFEKDEHLLKSCEEFMYTELQNKDIVDVKNFFEGCSRELHRMKKERLTVDLSLYDVILNSKHQAKECIPKVILSMSNCLNYNIYHSNIANYFDKSQLLSELQNQQIYFQKNARKISLVPDCTTIIGYYLCNEDLLSLILAFYKPIDLQNIKGKSIKRQNHTDCKRKRCKIADVKL